MSTDINIIDTTPFRIDDYIKCKGITVENIGGRWRLAFIRCPKCREYISIYKDEIDNTGKTKLKKCPCGFRKTLILKKWKK